MLQTLVKFMLIGTLGIGLQVLLMMWQSKTARFRSGWRYLTPGPMMWVAVIGGALMTGLFCYIYFFVGSARSDAESQMRALLGLIIGFDLLTMLTAYSIVAEQVRWNDTHIERRTWFYQRRSMSWHELAAFGIEEPSGYGWVSGFAGPRIRFSPYCNGFRELLRKIAQHLPTNLPPAEAAPQLEMILARI